jgi:hypothetical protein
MKAIISSISILLISILLVIGCEVIEKSIHDEDHSITETESVQESATAQSSEEYTRVNLKEEESDRDDIPRKPDES